MDDHAATLRGHYGHQLAVQTHRGQERARQVLQPVGVRHGQHPVRDPGLGRCVVDQDVDTAQQLQRCDGQPSRALRGGQVGGDKLPDNLTAPRLRAATTTCAPAASKALATVAPSPLVPPVTTTRAPSISGVPAAARRVIPPVRSPARPE